MSLYEMCFTFTGTGKENIVVGGLYVHLLSTIALKYKFSIMHVGDILRLFLDDHTVFHYRIAAIHADTLDLESPNGMESLAHEDGLIELLGTKHIVGFHVLSQRDTIFRVGMQVRVAFTVGSLRAEVLNIDEDILELRANDKVIYIDLDNLPPNIRSVVPISEDLADALPIQQMEWIDAPLQLHLLEHQLLSLYSAVSEHPKLAKSIVRQFKLLHRAFTTESFEPKIPTLPFATDRSDFMWLLPIAKVQKRLMADAASMPAFLSSLQSCMTAYAAGGTEDRYAQYTSCLNTLFTPATSAPGTKASRMEARTDTNAVKPAPGGVEVVPVKRFIQTFADTSVAITNYFNLPRAVPFSRVSLTETTLYEKTRLHLHLTKFYRAVRFWVRNASPSPLTSAPPLSTLVAATDSFSVHAAVRELEPYGYYGWHIPVSVRTAMLSRIASRIQRYKASLHTPKAAKSISHPRHEPVYGLPPLLASERLAEMLAIDALRSRFKGSAVLREVSAPPLKTGYPGCLPDDCESDKTIQSAIRAQPTVTEKTVSLPPKNKLVRRKTLLLALATRYDIRVPDRPMDALPERAVSLLAQYSAIVSEGITDATAPTLLALLQTHGRSAEPEENKAWVYFRDDDLKSHKFIPAVVEELVRARVDNVYPAVYDSLLSSGRVAVEDGLLLDKGTGFALSVTDPKNVDEYENGFKIVHTAILARDVTAPVFSVSDQPLLQITRALSDSLGVSLASYHEYIVGRVRGLAPSLVVPTISALIVIFVERSTGAVGWTTRVLQAMEGMAVSMKRVADTPTHVYWKALPPKIALAPLVAELANDFMIDRLVPVATRPERSLHTWPTFLPPKDFVAGNCVAPQSRKDRVVRGKLAACAAQIVGFVRTNLRSDVVVSVEAMHMSNADIRMRVGVVNELRRTVDPTPTRRRAGERRDFVAAAAPIPLGTAPVPVDVESILTEWGIGGPSGVDMGKLGEQIRVYTNFVCECTEQESTPDFVGSVLGRWKGLVGLRDFLAEYVTSISMTFPHMVMHGFAYFGGETLEKTDGVMPRYMMGLVTPAHVSEVLKDGSKYYAPLRVPSAEAVARVFAARARGQPVGETVLLDASPPVQFARNYDARRDEFRSARAVANVARFHPDVETSVALLKFCVLFVLSRFLVAEDGELDAESRAYACSIVQGCLKVLRSDVARFNQSADDVASAMRRSKIKEAKRFNLRITDEDRQTRVRRVFLSEQGLTEDARIGRTFKHSKVKESLEEAEFAKAGLDSMGNEMEEWEDETEPDEN
jgi:hypothetical protein